MPLEKKESPRMTFPCVLTSTPGGGEEWPSRRHDHQIEPTHRCSPSFLPFSRPWLSIERAGVRFNEFAFKLQHFGPRPSSYLHEVAAVQLSLCVSSGWVLRDTMFQEISFSIIKLVENRIL